MPALFRIAPLALGLLPFLSHAQVQPAAAVGLEMPAPAAPAQGHFLAGAYVSGNYTPALATGTSGYAVQPYLRYVLGTGRRARPFVQYSFSPLRVQWAHGSVYSLYGPGGVEMPVNPGFAPLAAQNSAYARNAYGGLGAFSVGVPMQLGRSSVLLDLGSTMLSGLFPNVLR